MILGPDGLPIAGSANASVRGMMRDVGAKLGVIFSDQGGMEMFKIVIEKATSNCMATSTEIVRLVKSKGIKNATVFTAVETQTRRNMVCLLGIGTGSAAKQCVRYRDGVYGIASVGSEYDSDSRVGDEYWVIPVQGIPDIFNIG